MENLNQWTERMLLYFNAPRPIKNHLYPTKGFYFIRNIIEKKLESGDVYPVGIVNWKPTSDDFYYENIEGNNFYLRLDLLYGPFCVRPDIAMSEIKHRIIEVLDTYDTKWIRNGVLATEIVVKWELQKEISFSDLITYSNLLLPLELEYESIFRSQQDELDQQIEDAEMFGNDFSDQEQDADDIYYSD